MAEPLSPLRATRAARGASDPSAGVIVRSWGGVRHPIWATGGDATRVSLTAGRKDLVRLNSRADITRSVMATVLASPNTSDDLAKRVRGLAIFKKGRVVGGAD